MHYSTDFTPSSCLCEDKHLNVLLTSEPRAWIWEILRAHRKEEEERSRIQITKEEEEEWYLTKKLNCASSGAEQHKDCQIRGTLMRRSTTHIFSYASIRAALTLVWGNMPPLPNATNPQDVNHKRRPAQTCSSRTLPHDTAIYLSSIHNMIV